MSDASSLPRLDSQSNHYADPFLKWAGSKRKLLHHILPFMPEFHGRYYEPFLGGGSLFFSLGPRKATIGDISRDLIETYRAIRDNVDAVIQYLKPLRQNKSTYYRVRENMSEGRFKRAAQFIYLNKTCWNGLYRVNSAGKFNVPYGLPKSDFIFDQENLRRCSRLLQRSDISIRCSSYKKSLERVKSGDLVFLDPPYVTTHNMNGFLEWNENIFSWNDQLRLAELANLLIKRGANVVVTNADHDEVRALYEGFDYANLHRHSTLASNGALRRRVSEAIFFSGPAFL